MSSEIFCFGFSAKRTSRLVNMPTSLPDFSTTGIPDIRFCSIVACASARVASGAIVIGLTTMPDSNRFTCRTAAVCCSMVRLRCNTPIPPICAMTIAMSDSVTVSMAEERIGIFRPMSLEMLVLVSAWLGTISDAAGRSRTSSNVSPSRMSLCLPGLLMIATFRYREFDSVAAHVISYPVRR